MLNLNFSQFPVLETERLILRSITDNDIDAFYQIRTHPVMMLHFNRDLPETYDQIKELIQNRFKSLALNTAITWGIQFKTSEKLIGTIGFHNIDHRNYRAEIGYMLHPDLWRQGIMNEASTKIIEFGFENLNFHSIEARISPKNEKSTNLVVKHGFVKEGYFKESHFMDGVFHDSVIYSLLAWS